jgi:hypothetical protein
MSLDLVSMGLQVDVPLYKPRENEYTDELPAYLCKLLSRSAEDEPTSFLIEIIRTYIVALG